jgi:hypothetical protein
VADERVVDEHLGFILSGVLDALYQTKQAAWSASGSPAQTHLRELVSYLIDRSGALMQAEERIHGRAPGISSPSSHQRGNLVAEGDGDLAAAIAVLVERLDALAADVRTRAAAIADAEEAPMLTDLADGLEARTTALRAG